MVDPRNRRIKQIVAFDPDGSASVDTRSPGVRIGTWCTRAQRHSSNGRRPWPTPYEG